MLCHVARKKIFLLKHTALRVLEKNRGTVLSKTGFFRLKERPSGPRSRVNSFTLDLPRLANSFARNGPLGFKETFSQSKKRMGKRKSEAFSFFSLSSSFFLGKAQIFSLGTNNISLFN
jgi:hypothetical protein